MQIFNLVGITLHMHVKHAMLALQAKACIRMQRLALQAKWAPACEASLREGINVIIVNVNKILITININ